MRILKQNFKSYCSIYDNLKTKVVGLLSLSANEYSLDIFYVIDERAKSFSGVSRKWPRDQYHKFLYLPCIKHIKPIQ